jgi:hypothetical protein
MSKAYYAAILGDISRVDKGAGIIRGVCVMAMGEVPDRNLYVDDLTLSRLVSLCSEYANGVKVKADHKSGILGVSGVLRNFRVENGAARADLHLLSSDENRDKLLEMAEEIPDTFGLSVSIEQDVVEYQGRMSIRPTAVFSVDLVTDPAACPNGLFSQQSNRRPIDAKPNTKMSPDEMTNKFAALEKSLSDFMSKCEERFKKYECDPQEDDSKFAKLEADMKATREEFAKKLTETGDSLVTKVAAEFSKVIGTVSVVKAAPAEAAAPAGVEDEKTAAANFEKLVKAEFAKTSSKTAAMKAALAADAKGYAAFMKAGKPINYAKTA